MAESQPSVEVPDGAKSSYDRWVESEGVPVIKTFFVEGIRKVQLDWWERTLRAFGSKKYQGAAGNISPQSTARKAARRSSTPTKSRSCENGSTKR